MKIKNFKSRNKFCYFKKEKLLNFTPSALKFICLRSFHLLLSDFHLITFLFQNVWNAGERKWKRWWKLFSFSHFSDNNKNNKKLKVFSLQHLPLPLLQQLSSNMTIMAKYFMQFPKLTLKDAIKLIHKCILLSAAIIVKLLLSSYYWVLHHICMNMNTQVSDVFPFFNYITLLTQYHHHICSYHLIKNMKDRSLIIKVI